MPRDHKPQQESQLQKELLHLCNCYEITRTDGRVYRLTDHSELLKVDISGTGEGVLRDFFPNDGAETSATEKTADFNPENAEIRGIISSDMIIEDDIRAGLLKNAKLTRYLVDWRCPWSGFFEKETFEFGSIAWGQTAYLGEIIGLKARADLSQGRRYTIECRHVFGSTECGKDLESPDENGNPITARLSVASISDQRKTFFASAKGGQWNLEDFRYGKITFTSGANSGLSFEVATNTAVSTVTNTLSFTLSLFSGYDIAVGDEFTAIQGCTKSRASCVGRYNNFLNYGGFPYMPGSDRVQQRPKVRQQ